jgi:ankyrin repeat protein
MRRRRAALLTLLLLASLVGGTGLWLRAQQRQYALNRALIAALVKGNDKRALALVNEGADPNTRYEPTPVPSLLEMVKQLFHRSPMPGNDSPTAFLMACGAVWIRDGQSVMEVSSPDAPQLVQNMLAHGADLELKSDMGWTPLIGALFIDHKETVCLLLAKRTWNINSQDEVGNILLLFPVNSPLTRPFVERPAAVAPPFVGDAPSPPWVGGR